MEYEIQDEQVLFDESTNPSLLPDDHAPVPRRPAERHKVQKGEFIPEEEEQPS